MEDKNVEEFLKMLKKESIFHYYLEKEVIDRFLIAFNGDYVQMIYSNQIDSPLDMALEFYKDYNRDYYHMILKGIKEEKIVVSRDLKKSFVDTRTGSAFIKLENNDGDIFNLVHEFAHFIDRNTTPSIIPDKYYFLSETFSFFIEKKLEIWLGNYEHKDLISTRKNNRMFFESKMMRTVSYVMDCISLYQQVGIIEPDSLDINKIDTIISYDYDPNVGIVNTLLQYPLANVLSSHLIDENLIQGEQDFCEVCFNTDLYKALEIKNLKKIF